MGLLEIVLICIGLVIFVISFIIPERKIESDDVQTISEDQIRQLVSDEYDRTKSRLDDITDETINYSMEKAERKLERISNEKMLAMGEYSDAILDQISTNHQEVVFLHDMLNQNKNDLTVMLSQAIKDASDAADMSNRAMETAMKAEAEAENAVNVSMDAANQSVVAEEKMISARKAIAGEEEHKEYIPELSDDIQALLYEDIIEEPKKTKTTRKTTKKSDDTKSQEKKTTRRKAKNENVDMSLNLSSDMDNNGDVSDVKTKVLKMHKAGKSNVAIARELGLGVGEVQLFIDLFK